MNGCELLKCSYYYNNMCNDPLDWVNENGDDVCRLRDDAILKIMKNKLIYLDYEAKPGDRVEWYDMANVRYEGIVVKMENEIATIQLLDGTLKDVKC